MDFCRLIQDLLIKNESVTVPGLGTFTLQYVPAQLFKFTNKVAPPSNELSFSSNINESDFSLIISLSQEYDFSEKDIASKLAEWVTEQNTKLTAGETVYLKDLGSLHKENESIKFTVDKNSSLLAGNFGLESTSLPLLEIEDQSKTVSQPITSSPTVAKKTTSSPRLKKWLIAATIIVFIIASISVVYEMGYLDNAIKKVAELFEPSKPLTKPQLATNDTLDGKTDANLLKRSALQYKEDSIKDTAAQVKITLKYYLIAGSFKTLKNAEKLRDEMVTKGYTPEILNLGDTTYRVSVASFMQRRQAVEEYIAISAKESDVQVWLFSQQVPN